MISFAVFVEFGYAKINQVELRGTPISN